MRHNPSSITKRLSPYRGLVFRWQRYKAASPQWNHDHCAGCSTRFAEHPEEWLGVVHTEGWVTLWPVKIAPGREQQVVSEWRAAGKVLVPSPKLNGFQLDWICPKCFETCRAELEFTVDPDHPRWQQAGL